MTRGDTDMGQAFLLAPGNRREVGERLTLGRDAGADVTLDTAEASRLHAEIVRHGNRYTLTDLDSKNGTYLNGGPVDVPRELSSGDTIRLAGVTFRFLIRSGETKIASAWGGAVATAPLRLTGDRVTIGRAPSNNVVLDDPTVSWLHAELVREEDAVLLRDLSSANGTYVEGRPVGELPIDPGTTLRIGHTRLRYDGDRIVADDERPNLRLDVDGVTFEVGGKRILSSTSLSVEPGELTVIIGESGSGKSTLLHLLAGVTTPTSGAVTLGGESVVTRTTDIGFVPQHEIVHRSLTVKEALYYSARLRLPPDTGREEIGRRIASALESLGLTEVANNLIGSQISGGQLRRVGIGVELLESPSLLCLDEPTTGLDPLREKEAMTLFRSLASGPRSVVLVTHTMQCLELADRLVAMGAGGKLMFSGPPEEAVRFFAADSLAGIHAAISRRSSDEWSARWRQRAGEGGSAQPPPARRPSARPQRRRPFGFQARLLTGRYLRTFGRDRRNLLIVFGQVPLIALAILGLFSGDVFSRARSPDDAAHLLFVMVTITIWLGLLDAARELIKEREVFKRERAVGLRVSAYVASKLALLAAVVVVQVGTLCALVFFFRPLHEDPATYVGVVSALLLTGLVAIGFGLLTSTLASSQDQAISLVPLMLVPQLLFAGGLIPLVKLSGVVAALTNLVFAKWAFALLGTLIDFNQRIALEPKAAHANTFGHDFFAAPIPLSYAVIGSFLAAFTALAATLVSRRA